MPTKSRRGARSSEEVGQRIASEMSSLFALHQQTTQELVRKRIVDAMSSLRTALYEAVEGFNDQAPWAYHLAVLNRGDRLLFNSFGQFTLTVTFGDDQVMIDPTPETTPETSKSEVPVVVDIVRVDGKPRYRTAPPSATAFETPMLTELQFVDSVIRLACNSRKARQTAC